MVRSGNAVKVTVTVLSAPRLVNVQVAVAVPLPETVPPFEVQLFHVAVEPVAAEAVRVTDCPGLSGVEVSVSVAGYV